MSVRAILQGQSYTQPEVDALLTNKQDTLTIKETIDNSNDIPTCAAVKIQTDTMEAALADSMAILADGNTHAAITNGQYVYVRNHSTLADGLYKATANISTVDVLSETNVAAISDGGLNNLRNASYTNLYSGSTTVPLTVPEDESTPPATIPTTIPLSESPFEYRYLSVTFFIDSQSSANRGVIMIPRAPVNSLYYIPFAASARVGAFRLQLGTAGLTINSALILIDGTMTARTIYVTNINGIR